MLSATVLPEVQPDADDHRERAARRARGRVRRYALANGCSRLLTLTYRPPQPTDPDVVLRDVQAFQRRLGAAYPRVAWVRVFERHRSGALHVHLIASAPIRKAHLAALWGHGFVDGRRLGKPGQGGRDRARAGARYAAKYIGKGSVAGFGRHSYEVREGFQPVAVRVREWTGTEAWTAAVRLAGGEVPKYEWSSSSIEAWRGPPAVFLAWA